MARKSNHFSSVRNSIDYSSINKNESDVKFLFRKAKLHEDLFKKTLLHSHRKYYN